MLPKNAIVAVTLNCNSRCIMCDIWKNRIVNELPPKEYLKLPSSLVDINITGGEPFLRRDLVDIIRNIKTAAPRARLIMSSNGFLPHRAAEDLPKIITIDPSFALRVSIDGMGAAHDNIRKIPDGFNKILRTIKIAQDAGVRDLGVSLTVINKNVGEIPKVRSFCKKNNLEFSITVVTNSSIYFGNGKEALRPVHSKQLEDNMNDLARDHFFAMTPKEIMRGWFVSKLLQYVRTGRRPLPCDAGSGFFYMDSTGNIYTCHMKPWLMGNITKDSVRKIFQNNAYASQVARCNSCWMVCTAKTMIKKRLAYIAPGLLPQMISAAVR